METQIFVNIKNQYAAAICKTLELNEEARVLLRNSTTSAQYLQQLLKNRLYDDAIVFFAHALPKREAAWWACLCVRLSLSKDVSPAEIHALELTEKWVHDPSEENRKLTMPAAIATAFKNPAGWAAVAAFWSGEHLSSLNNLSPAHEDLSAKAIINAVTMAATVCNAENTNNIYKLFFQHGIHVACYGIDTR